MSILLAVTTLLILLVADYFRRSRLETAVAKPVFVKRYVHPGHAWLRETEDGDVLVGLDEFAGSLIGSIDAIQLPRLLRKVEQGGVALTVRHGSRVVPILSPVSGRVIEKNEMIMTDPSLVNSSPYGDGWLYRVRPVRLSSQLHNLVTGKQSQQWLDAVRARLGRFFSGTPALMYQDGGVMVNNLSDRCSDEEWSRLVKEFFLVEDTTSNS